MLIIVRIFDYRQQELIIVKNKKIVQGSSDTVTNSKQRLGTETVMNRTKK